MAYNTSTGSRDFDDMRYQQDRDTQIDWDQDSISFKTNDITRVVIDNSAISASGDATFVGATVVGSTLNVSGNVGIGTALSSALVHIYKAATTSALPLEMIRLESQDEGVDMNAGHGPAITFYVGETGGSDHGGTVAVVREEASDADSAAAMVFHTAIDDTTPAERMRITSTGKVGIGTKEPTDTLTVVADVSGSGTLQIVGNTFLGLNLNVSGTTTLAGLNFSLGSDAEGDMYYRNSAGALTRLAKGDDDQVMTMDGNVPNW